MYALTPNAAFPRETMPIARIDPLDSAAALAPIRIHLPPHSDIAPHDYGDSDVVLMPVEGTPVVYVGGKARTLRSGDSVLVTHGKKLSLRNASDTAAVLLAVASRSDLVEALPRARPLRRTLPTEPGLTKRVPA